MNQDELKRLKELANSALTNDTKQGDVVKLAQGFLVMAEENQRLKEENEKLSSKYKLDERWTDAKHFESLKQIAEHFTEIEPEKPLGHILTWCCELVLKLQSQLEAANKRVEIAVEAIDVMLPIVEAAFWDVHTAGTMPGSGYNHKAETLASRQWGWRTSDKFTEWKKALAKIKGESK